MGVCDTQVHPRTTEKGFGEVMNGWENGRGLSFNRQKIFRTLATRGTGFVDLFLFPLLTKVIL